MMNRTLIALATTALCCAQVHAQCGPTLTTVTPATLAAAHRYGISVAVSGNVAIIGAEGDTTLGTNAGAAYIYRLSGSTWVFEKKVLAPDGGANDKFGHSVAISGDLAIVGAYQDSAGANNSGSAHVFRYVNSNWVHERKLMASDPMAWDWFGYSVALSGSTAVIGAYTDAPLTDAGSVYVFRNTSGSTWVQDTKIMSPEPGYSDLFGSAVSIAGDILAIGAYWDDDWGTNSGAAHIYRRSGTSWVHEKKLVPNDGSAGDAFGYSVAILSDRVVVGAYMDDDRGVDSGAAYIYRKTATAGWQLEQKLAPTDGAANDKFGYSVTIGASHIAIGAYHDDDAGSNSGSVYIYRFTTGSSPWVQVSKLTSSSGLSFDLFGNAVALSGDNLVVGSFGNDGQGADSGRAYIAKQLDGAGAGGPDCNDNGAPDACDISSGLSSDANSNGIPDECESGPTCAPDTNGDDLVNVNDLLSVINAWGSCTGACDADVTGDDVVNVNDLLAVINAWGVCP